MSDPSSTSVPEITPLPAEGHRGIDSFSVARITGATSFSELLDAFRRVEAEHRQRGRCFLTLDFLNQCLYTSGHAIGAHNLDDGVDYPEDDDPAAQAAYETALFRAVSAVLHTRDRKWKKVAGKLFTDPSDIEALVRLNRDPGLVLDDVHVVQCLPTDDDVDLLANIPNGYFVCDWTPFDCYAVVRRISGRHGYALFGIGASTLGFLSVADPGERDLSALITDLRQLYGHSDSSAWADLAAVVESSPVLLLGYTEGLAETVEPRS